MTFDEGLTEYLKQLPAVVATVGARVYPRKVDYGGTMPALTYDIISPVEMAENQQGRSTLRRTRVQLTVWDKSYRTVERASAAIENAIKGYRGQWGSGTDAIRVDSIRFVSQTDDEHEVSGLKKRMTDYYVTHSTT